VTTRLIRQNLAAVLKAAVIPTTSAKCFKSVFEDVPASVDAEEMPACVISIDPEEERRLTEPAGAGTKQIAIQIQLDILFALEPIDVASGDRLLDDILDGVAAACRAPSALTLSGALALMGERVSTERHEPSTSSASGGPSLVTFTATRRLSGLDFVNG
jgi:hypothetical protein